MAGILEFVAGPLFGLVGGIANKVMDLQVMKEQNSHELKKFDFELSMRDKERIARKEENEQNMAANQLDVEGQLATTITAGTWDGLKASIEADAKQTGTSYRWVEAIRSLMRPGLTIVGMAALTTGCFVLSGDLVSGAWNSMYTNSSMMLAWWFGTRETGKVVNRYMR